MAIYLSDSVLWFLCVCVVLANLIGRTSNKWYLVIIMQLVRLLLHELFITMWLMSRLTTGAIAIDTAVSLIRWLVVPAVIYGIELCLVLSDD